uniref:ATPase inhibitor, mitochondrial n=1 Tax=Chelydra serpentina TaxID=8475 RepID=A0A8C3S0Y3_CHESE
MAAAGLRGGLRGVLFLQQRGWSSGSDQLGELGSGAGKGGGGGGSIREAGGAFGKRQAAHEERYFRDKEREQLASLREHHEEEISHHKREMERLQKEIERHKYKIKKLKVFQPFWMSVQVIRMVILVQTKGPSSPVSCLPTVANAKCPRGSE